MCTARECWCAKEARTVKTVPAAQAHEWRCITRPKCKSASTACLFCKVTHHTRAPAVCGSSTTSHMSATAGGCRSQRHRTHVSTAYTIHTVGGARLRVHLKPRAHHRILARPLQQLWRPLIGDRLQVARRVRSGDRGVAGRPEQDSRLQLYLRTDQCMLGFISCACSEYVVYPAVISRGCRSAVLYILLERGGFARRSGRILGSV